MAPFRSQERIHLTRQRKSKKHDHEEAALGLPKARLEALHHCTKSEAESGRQNGSSGGNRRSVGSGAECIDLDCCDES